MGHCISAETATPQKHAKKRKLYTYSEKTVLHISHYSSWVPSWNILVSRFTMRLFRLQNWDIHSMTPQVISTLVSACVSSPDQRCPPQVWAHKRAFGRQSTPSNAGSGRRGLSYGSRGKEMGGEWRKRHVKKKKAIRRSSFQNNTKSLHLWFILPAIWSWACILL